MVVVILEGIPEKWGSWYHVLLDSIQYRAILIRRVDSIEGGVFPHFKVWVML